MSNHALSDVPFNSHGNVAKRQDHVPPATYALALTPSALNLIWNIVFLLFFIKWAHRACTATFPLTTLPNNSPTATNIKQSR